MATAVSSTRRARPRALSRALNAVRRGIERVGANIARGVLRFWSVAQPLGLLTWRYVSPKLAIVSTAGWLAVAVALAALGAGFALGWQELTYVGVTIAIAIVACAVFLLGRSSYRVGVELTPSRVVVGVRAFGRLTVRNVGTRGVLPARMELPVGAGLATFAVPGLKPDAEHEELFAVPTNRRAVVVAGPAVSVRGDELGLLRRTVRWNDPIDLFVHPTTIGLAPSAAGLVRDLEGQVTKTITNNDLSFHALRSYEPGDDRRYVHWRSSARTGQLMVRQFEETRRSQLTIVHSVYKGYYASDDEFELAVSVMASMATQIIRDGTQSSVVTESQLLRTHSPTALLDDTCRIEPIARKHASAREFVREVTRRLPLPSVLLVVAGSAMTTTDYRSIELLFPSGTTMIAFRVDLGAPPSLKPVSGMLIATVGELADLPKVLRRAAG